MDVSTAENSARTDDKPGPAAPDIHLSGHLDDSCPLCALLEIRDVMRELYPILKAVQQSPMLRRFLL